MYIEINLFFFEVLIFIFFIITFILLKNENIIDELKRELKK